MFSILVCAVLSIPAADPRTVLDELTVTGLDIPGGPRFKLPAPSMAAGLSAEKQDKVLEVFADEYPEGLFVRRTVTAPYKLKVNSIGEGREKRRGHTIDLWFVAYGKMEQVEKDNVVGQLMGLNRKDGKGLGHLTEKDLRGRKIVPVKQDGIEERFVLLDAVLIDKVHLTGVLRSQKRKIDGSLVSTMIMDERFATDRDHPNQWQVSKGERDEKQEFGPPSVYKGFGGYAKVTPLAKPAGALFIEMHFAFHEPYGWFQGHNVLASKLPLAVRDNVIAVRRKLGGK